MSNPLRVAAAPDGGFYVMDMGNARVRRVAPDGTITTVVGGGPFPDRRTRAARACPGTEIRLATVMNPIAVGPDGSLYVADTDNGGMFIRHFGVDGKSQGHRGRHPGERHRRRRPGEERRSSAVAPSTSRPTGGS